MDHMLHPLRIPRGWHMLYNEFRALDPTDLPDAASALWSYFKEDLLQLVHDGQQVVVDLGWYPEADARGVFRAVVVRKTADSDEMAAAWSEPLASVESRSCVDIVTTIEAWLLQYTTAMVENSGDQAPGNIQ